MEKCQNYQQTAEIKYIELMNDLVNKYLTKYSIFSRRYQTRKQLKSLTQEQLDDIGINSAQAQSEANKPFWK